MTFVFFFFKQKTAYEMRISDWSSDVCSSDLRTADCGDCSAIRPTHRPTRLPPQTRISAIHRHYKALTTSPPRQSSIRSGQCFWLLRLQSITQNATLVRSGGAFLFFFSKNSNWVLATIDHVLVDHNFVPPIKR